LRQALENAKKKLELENEDLTSRYEDEARAKSDLQKQKTKLETELREMHSSQDEDNAAKFVSDERMKKNSGRIRRSEIRV